MPDYKYNEADLLKELKDYIDSTYDEHYGKDKYQATEVIIDNGHGIGWALGNITKYPKRYGKKGGPEDWRRDFFKTLHYALIAVYVHDKEHPKNNHAKEDPKFWQNHDSSAVDRLVDTLVRDYGYSPQALHYNIPIEGIETWK